MAIINNNVQNVQFLRNQTIFVDKAAASAALENNKGLASDGSALLARYYGEGDAIKTLVGFVAVSGNNKYLTIIDVEGSEADVEALRTEINNKLGEGVTSANTATAQLAALSGATFTAGTSSSADTSVEGAKAYAYDLIGTLDYTDTAETGSYVSKVDQVDGKITTTKVALPTVAAISEAGKPITAVSENLGEISASAGTINAEYVNVTGETFTATTVQGALEEIDSEYKAAISGLDYDDTALAKKFVIAVDETDGVINVDRGEITSTDKTVVLTDGADGGVDFAVNIDNSTLQKNENGVISVTSSALVQYEGDDDTIQISAVQDGVRTVSSPLTIQKVTTGLSEIVKEEYRLIGASGNTIGAPVQIYKDSHIVSITYITEGEHAQNLEYVYIDASGNTQTTYVDMSELVLETEFASGVTVTDGIAHGVVDPTSETFLTVGANGFKLSGVQDAIDAAFEALDADESGSTAHVSVRVEEADGKITAVTVSEDNIANANDLAELSAKTVTALTSTNGSITTQIDEAVGCKTYDIETDADKIKMSGFSADNTSALSGIAESDSIATAFEKTNTVITENEQVTSAALNDLDGRLDVIESGYVETVKVNNVELAETNNAVNVQIASAPATGAASSPINVATDQSTGAVTLTIQGIDCGYYDGSE